MNKAEESKWKLDFRSFVIGILIVIVLLVGINVLTEKPPQEKYKYDCTTSWTDQSPETWCNFKTQKDWEKSFSGGIIIPIEVYADTLNIEMPIFQQGSYDTLYVYCGVIF